MVQERTARLTLERPEQWPRADASGADLVLHGDDVTVTVRSRPSDNTIADESTALLGRLPGAVDGVQVIGCDPWSGAEAPARLVEYARPAVDDDEQQSTTFVSHLLLTTGRHRLDVVAERPLAALARTDDAVFAVLESVRVIGPVRGGDTVFETFPDVTAPTPEIGPRIDAEALTTLQGMVGRRWNPAALRTPGGRGLVDAGLVGRFGSVPASTAAVLAPWEADAEPFTLEQDAEGGRATRLQAWSGEGSVTLLDGTDDAGFALGASAPDRAVAVLAGRLGLAPTWTRAFRTERLGAELVERRLRDHGSVPALPEAIASEDEVLARFWAAPWTVSWLRRPGRPRPVTIVHAPGVGFARIGRTEAGSTAIRAEAPAALYRLVAAALLG